MKKDEFRSLIVELDGEIGQEKSAAMSTDERRLNEVARKLLQLERDLMVPGSTASDKVRRERILNWIEQENF